MTILAKHKSYYDALERNNAEAEITNWLRWFAGSAIEAQRRTTALIEFLPDKTHLLDRLKGKLNERQEKILLRLRLEGSGHLGADGRELESTRSRRAALDAGA